MDIIVCSVCKGKGENYADAELNSENVSIKCNNCNGTGRMIQRIYRLELPFDFNINEFSKVDSEIIKLINKLK